MPSTVPTVKAGLRDWLRTQTGLRPQDGVAVYGSTRGINDALNSDMVILAGVTAPQATPVTWPDLREENPTLTGFCVARRPGTGDDAEDAARDRAYALFAVLEQALETDPTAGGVIGGPMKGTLASGDLTEGAGDESDQGVRWAEVRWTLTWTSDY